MLLREPRFKGMVVLVKRRVGGGRYRFASTVA
jgi:hypothetical protein